MDVLNFILNIIRMVFNFFIIIGKCILLLIQLIVVVIEAFVRRYRSKGSFRHELNAYGVPSDAADRLTESYRELVSLNVFSYAGSDKHKAKKH